MYIIKTILCFHKTIILDKIIMCGYDLKNKKKPISITIYHVWLCSILILIKMYSFKNLSINMLTQ